MFSKANQLIESGEEIQKTAHPSVFESKYAKETLTGIGIFILLLALMGAKAAFEIEAVPYSVIILSFALPVFILSRAHGRRLFVMYHFTNKQIIEEDGMLNKNFRSVDYDRIQNVSIDEDIEERIFDVGDIHVKTSGTGGTDIVLEGLRNPEKYERIISKRSHSGNEGIDPSTGGNKQSQKSMSQQNDFNTNNSSNNEVIESDVLSDELERVNREIGKLNKKMNSQGLSNTERERWYRLDGQRDLLQRFVDETKEEGDSIGSGMDGDLDLNI